VTLYGLLDVIGIYLERAASIFKVEDYADEARRVNCSPVTFFYFSAYLSSLNLEAVRSFKTSGGNATLINLQR
jgi:hypothetical protein